MSTKPKHSKAAIAIEQPSQPIIKPKTLHRLLIIVLIALFYSNSLTLNYALDDRMVIMESKYTIEGGWQGLKGIFSEDTFSGYFNNNGAIVTGGRYRPMSQFTFMLEFQLFGQKIKQHIGDLNDYDNLHNATHEQYFVNSHLPLVSHLFNVVYFILLCLLIYNVLEILFGKYSGPKWYQSLPFIVTLLFALHPIHTEAVTNVKGRDEIFSMLGATFALWACLKYVDKRHWGYLVLSFLGMLFGCFSKENAITYLAVIPLSLYFYNNKNKKKIDYFITLIPAFAGTIIFIATRSHVLGGMLPTDTTDNILNNPYIYSTKAQEIATVLLTWAIYFRLLIFPHPLTHDYYPKQIAITDFSNPAVWLILLCCIALVVYAVVKLKKQSIISFGILFFVITFSITSNLFFNIGTFMNERFVFIPSLGFTLIIGYWIYLLSTAKSAQLQWVGPTLLMTIGLLYGVKTFTRNFVWKDDFSLFLTDVSTSSNSIKCNVSAGGSELQIWKKSHKERDKQAAYRYLSKALQLDNHAFNAYLLLGELMYLDNNPTGAYQAYRNATLIDPHNQMAQENLAKMQTAKEDAVLDPIMKMLDAGKVQEALQQINDYLAKNPQSLIALNIKGNIYGRGMNRLDEAIDIYNQVLAKDPKFASAWENKGIAYAIKKQFKEAVQCLQTGLQYAPGNLNMMNNLYLVYKNMGDNAKADDIQRQIQQLKNNQ